jgi:hypothetical protein
MPTYNEKTGFVVRNSTTGAPLTSASVQLKRGLSTISMSHRGQGFYTADSVPRGRWEVWIDGVDSGMTHGVGVGKLEDIGHEVGLYPQSQSDGWAYTPIPLGDYIKRDGTSPTTAVIPFANGISGTSATFTSGYNLNTNTSDQGYVATSSAFTNGGLFLGRSSRGTVASPAALQSGDTILFLGGQGYGATGYSSLSRAAIRFHTSEAWTDAAQGTYISFSTTPNGSTTRAERGRIENDGVLSWLAGVSLTTGTAIPLVLNTTGASVGCQIRFDNVHTTTGWRWGLSSDTLGDMILVNDDLGTIPFRYAKSNDLLTIGAAASIVGNLTLQSNLLINNPTDTFAYTIVGGAITANRQLNIPVITATDTLAVLGLAQTFGAAQTARAWALTNQSNSPATAYTWTLTSGNQASIDLASSTGAVTITTASPTAGAFSKLSVLGHATLARNLTLTQSGVTFVMAGKTPGNSILLDSIGALERVAYHLHWISTTLCFVERINALSGGMQLSGHNQFTSPWSFGNGADWNASTIGQRFNTSGTYQVWAKGNVLVEQAVSEAFTLYRPVTSATSEVCQKFDMQNSLGTQTTYAEVCGEIVSSTSGSEIGALRLEYRKGGVSVLGAKVGEDGLKPSAILRPVTITSIASGLRLNAVTSGTINNFISDNGIMAQVPFFGGSATLGIDSSAGVTIPVDTTFLVVTSPAKIAFPRFFRTALSNSVGASIIEIECVADTTTNPSTYTFRNRTAFTLGAGGTFNQGNPMMFPIVG